MLYGLKRTPLNRDLELGPISSFARILAGDCIFLISVFAMRIGKAGGGSLGVKKGGSSEKDPVVLKAMIVY